jgi:ceramide glucosyltransferase
MCRVLRARRPLVRRAPNETVTIVRPVFGIESGIEDTLRSGFQLQYSNYEQIFCAHTTSDPIVPLVKRLIAEHSNVRSRLLYGDEQISGNPKLNNLAKSWPEIRSKWVLFCDSNVLLSPDFIQRQFEACRPSTGVVTSCPVAVLPKGFWAEVECSFLNPYHARWHIAVAALGFGFAHGKSMLIRRSFLEEAGGIDVLASEIAEDTALTKLVRARGLKVASSDVPVFQPLGQRTALELYHRQARWARLRRLTFPIAFLPEVLSGGVFPTAAVAILAVKAAVSVPLAIMGETLFWYGTELLFAVIVGWHVSWRTLPASVLRDILIPIIWLYAWIGQDFRWRGSSVYGKASGHLSAP